MSLLSTHFLVICKVGNIDLKDSEISFRKFKPICDFLATTYITQMIIGINTFNFLVFVHSKKVFNVSKTINDTGVMQMHCHLYLKSLDARGINDIKNHAAYQAICDRFAVSPDDVVIEIVDVQKPLSEQRLLKELVTQKINRNDTLIIPHLSCLGRNVEDIEEALFFCFRKEINIYCYHSYTRIEPTAESCISFLIAIQTSIDIHNLKSTRSKYRGMKNTLGRKEGSRYKADIVKLKTNGYKQTDVARLLRISISTVKRHWNTTIIG
ncbi:TPA: recombinase family protein [Klebsiella aerogenes]